MARTDGQSTPLALVSQWASIQWLTADVALVVRSGGLAPYDFQNGPYVVRMPRAGP